MLDRYYVQVSDIDAQVSYFNSTAGMSFHPDSGTLTVFVGGSAVGSATVSSGFLVGNATTFKPITLAPN